MTICIAALCEQGKVVIAASDRMLTDNNLSLEFEHSTPKQRRVGRNCVIMSAGGALSPIEVFQEVDKDFGVNDEPLVSKVAESARNAMRTLRNRHVEDQVLGPRGLTLAQFYQGGLTTTLLPQIAADINEQIQGYQLGCQILVCGEDEKGGHVWAVGYDGMHCYDEIGFAAIGSGEGHAENSLVADGYNMSLPLMEAVFAIYTARRRAEKAPGVGREMDFSVIGLPDRGVVDLPEPLRRELEQLYLRRLEDEQKLVRSLQVDIKRLGQFLAGSNGGGQSNT